MVISVTVTVNLNHTCICKVFVLRLCSKRTSVVGEAVSVCGLQWSQGSKWSRPTQPPMKVTHSWCIASPSEILHRLFSGTRTTELMRSTFEDSRSLVTFIGCSWCTVVKKLQFECVNVNSFNASFQIAAVRRVQRHTGLTHHFYFLTFGHSGAQSWAPECPNVRN